MSIKFDPQKMPIGPGVYFFKDKQGRILYIGKATNLRNRVRSYFKSPADPRIRKMVSLAEKLDFEETGSEIEALILESQLIKKKNPQFNIMLRDDKQYFYVAISPPMAGQASEQFPKIFITHRPAEQEKIKLSPAIAGQATVKAGQAHAIGPFTDGTALRVTLRLLRKIFPYCTCKQRHNNHCLNYHIGNCPGFCCLKKEASPEEIKVYKKNIVALREILRGNKTSLVKKIEKNMAALAAQGDFKGAIEFRSQLERIKSVFENSRVIKEMESRSKESEQGLIEIQRLLDLPSRPLRIEGYDISNIQGRYATGSMVAFAEGQPDKNEYRRFKIRLVPGVDPSGAGDTGMLREVLTRRFRHSEWRFPDLILIDGGKGQLNAAKAVLGGLRLNIPLISLVKNEKHVGERILWADNSLTLVNMSPAARNLILRVDAEAHRFAISYYRNLHAKEARQLD